MSKAVDDSKTSSRDWLIGIGIVLFIGWLFFSLSAYYVVQKPFSARQLAALTSASGVWHFSPAALGRSILDVCTALWLAWIAVGLGRWLLARFNLEPLSAHEKLLLSFGLGFGGLGFLILLFGLAGLLETAVFWAIAILLTFFTSRQSLKLVRQLSRPHPPRAIALFILLTLGMAFFLAFLPPTSWDSLSYHLEGPKLYLQAGRIFPGPDIMPLHYPSLFEMLFMMAMALRGDGPAAFLHLLFCLPLAGIVYLTARTHLRLPSHGGWTAVLFLVAVPMVPLLAAWSYNDLALVFYQLTALYAFLCWQEKGTDGPVNWLLVAGIMAGLSMSLKYTGFIGPLLLAAFIAWKFRRAWRSGIRPFLAFALPAALIVSPWLLKNWAFTGNPVYPFLFDGRYWDAFRAAGNANSGSGLGLDIVAWLRLPYDLSLGYRDVSQDGPVGPLFLMLLPLLLGYGLARWRRRTPAALPYLLLFALGQYLFWMAGVISSANLWQSRYLLPGLAALCPALAWILADLKRFNRPQFSLQRFLNLVIAVAVALGLIGQFLTWLPQRPLAYALGDVTKEAVLNDSLGAYYGAMTAVNQLPSEAQVVFLWEPRSYYCDRACQPDIILDKLPHLIHLLGTADRIAAHWRDQGITHLLLFQAGLDFVAADGSVDTAVLDELKAHYLQPVAIIGSAYILYELRP